VAEPNERKAVFDSRLSSLWRFKNDDIEPTPAGQRDGGGQRALIMRFGLKLDLHHFVDEVLVKRLGKTKYQCSILG